ncbi:MAG: virulence factor TspB C-terminal domain-related protein [Thiobacillaceae bacterium]
MRQKHATIRRTTLVLCSIALFLGLGYIPLAQASAALAYSVPVTIPGASAAGVDGVTATMASTAGLSESVTVPLASANQAVFDISLVPNAARTASMVSRVVRIGSVVGLSAFVLEYLADRYIYPATNGTFVVDAGVVHPLGVLILPSSQDYYYPGDAGYPTNIPHPIDPAYNVPGIIFVWQPTPGACLNPSTASLTIWNNGFWVEGGDQAYCDVVAASSPSHSPLVGAAGRFGVLFLGDTPYDRGIIFLPLADPALIESQSLPAIKPFPDHADQPLPVDITIAQPYVDSAPYIDPVTGESMVDRSQVTISPDGQGGFKADVATSAVPSGSPLPAPNPTPSPQPQPAQSNAPDICKLYPKSLACSQLADPPSEPSPVSTLQALYEPFSGLSSGGGCPAPVTASTPWGSITIDVAYACVFALRIKPVVISMSLLASLLIVTGNRNNG